MNKKDLILRVSCLNVVPFDGQPIPTCSMIINGVEKMSYTRYGRICANGTGMTVDEMNENIIWKNKPYINIPYCKYCHSENTIGIVDDDPQYLGFALEIPDENIKYFRLKKCKIEKIKMR